MSDSLLGRTLGSYEILSQLGQGGMGTVYLAVQPRIGKQVAIKVLRPELAHDPNTLRRFFREARLVNELKHEHIIDILDFGETPEGLPFLTMELLLGETLGRRLARGPLEETQAREIGAQVAEALAVAHAAGVVHRDLKPENIYLCQRPSSGCFVKLLDFGIAKLTGETGVRERLTRTGHMMGTPYYMAPEQIDGRSVGPAADLYSLGCVLYEMLAGASPFAELTTLESVLVAHLHQPPPAMDLRAPGVSAGYAALVARCLVKTAEERTVQAAELAAELWPPAGLAAAPTPTRAARGPLPATLAVGRPAGLASTVRQTPGPASSGAAPDEARVAMPSPSSRTGRVLALWAGIPMVLVGALTALVLTLRGTPAATPPVEPAPPVEVAAAPPPAEPSLPAAPPPAAPDGPPPAEPAQQPPGLAPALPPPVEPLRLPAPAAARPAPAAAVATEASPAVAAADLSRLPGGAERAIRQAYREIDAAAIRKDADGIMGPLAAEYVFVDNTGAPHTRAQQRNLAVSVFARYPRVHSRIVVERLTRVGDQVRARVRVVRTYTGAGAPVVNDARVDETWVQRGGRWVQIHGLLLSYTRR